MAKSFNSNIRSGFRKSMEDICLELLHQGYEAMLIAKSYDIESEEDDISLQLVLQMEIIDLCISYQIEIIPQAPIYSEEHKQGLVNTKKAPKIDFKFSSWIVGKEKAHFFAEAKNLSETNWQKQKNTTQTIARDSQIRYIETGIDHLLSGYYPQPCILLGYIVQGKREAIVQKLNEKITNEFQGKNYGHIEKNNQSTWEEFYISENTSDGNTKQLKHLFLQLA